MQYRSPIKSAVFPEVFRFFGTDYEHSAKSRLYMQDLIPDFQHATMKDYVRGSHKNVRIELAEAHLTRRQGKHRVTTFKGVCILLSMNKNIATLKLNQRIGL